MQTVSELLSKLNDTDKNIIENKLVDIGTSAVPELVDKLQVVRGITRGVVAMTLIRIGSPSVEYLEKAASANEEFKWVAEYLISEINCKKVA